MKLNKITKQINLIEEIENYSVEDKALIEEIDIEDFIKENTDPSIEYALESSEENKKRVEKTLKAMAKDSIEKETATEKSKTRIKTPKTKELKAMGLVESKNDKVEKPSALDILKNNLDIHGEEGKIIVSLKGKLDDEDAPHIEFEVTEEEFDTLGAEFHNDEKVEVEEPIEEPFNEPEEIMIPDSPIDLTDIELEESKNSDADIYKKIDSMFDGEDLKLKSAINRKRPLFRDKLFDEAKHTLEYLKTYTGKKEQVCNVTAEDLYLEYFEDNDIDKPEVKTTIKEFIDSFFDVTEQLTEAKTKNALVKDWVKENFPDEFQTDLINPDITFYELFAAMRKGEDFYALASVDGEGFDSDVREKIFNGLEEAIGLDYNVFYNLWLNSEKIKSGEVVVTPQGKIIANLNETTVDVEELSEEDEAKTVKIAPEMTESKTIKFNDEYKRKLKSINNADDYNLSVDMEDEIIDEVPEFEALYTDSVKMNMKFSKGNIAINTDKFEDVVKFFEPVKKLVAIIDKYYDKATDKEYDDDGYLMEWGRKLKTQPEDKEESDGFKFRKPQGTYDFKDLLDVAFEVRGISKQQYDNLSQEFEKLVYNDAQDTKTSLYLDNGKEWDGTVKLELTPDRKSISIKVTPKDEEPYVLGTHRNPMSLKSNLEVIRDNVYLPDYEEKLREKERQDRKLKAEMDQIKKDNPNASIFDDMFEAVDSEKQDEKAEEEPVVLDGGDEEIKDINSFEPFEDVQALWDRIKAADKLDALKDTLEDSLGETLTASKLNEILAYQSEWLLDVLNMDNSTKVEVK